MVQTAAQTASQAAEQNERPPAPLRTQEFRAARPQIVGPETPEPPFPILLSGSVQKGFGRGGKDLGCPTGSHIHRVDDLDNDDPISKQTCLMSLLRL
jgi:riboflavin kinase